MLIFSSLRARHPMSNIAIIPNVCVLPGDSLNTETKNRTSSPLRNRLDIFYIMLFVASYLSLIEETSSRNKYISICTMSLSNTGLIYYFKHRKKLTRVKNIAAKILTPFKVLIRGSKYYVCELLTPPPPL